MEVCHLSKKKSMGQKPSAPPREISLDTLEKAKLYVEYTDTQKEIVMEVSTFLYIISISFSTKRF